MDQSTLLATAEQLPKASDAAIKEYESERETLVNQVNKYMLEREDINQLVGKANIEMMKDNHSNHALFVVSILSVPNAAVLVETVTWVFKAYRSRGFHPNYWASQLNAWLRVMEKHLNEASFREIFPLYNWFIVNIPIFTTLSEEIADENSAIDFMPEH